MTRLCVALITCYQRWLSPLTPPCCGFVPTCSAYAREALARHGLPRGLGLTIRRLLRCHPFHAGGVDPVP
jgi:putative membrane protein insertion efficiency factor